MDKGGQPKDSKKGQFWTGYRFCRVILRRIGKTEYHESRYCEERDILFMNVTYRQKKSTGAANQRI